MSVLISTLLTLRGLATSRVALHLEVLALRHQLQVLQRSRPRHLRLRKADRCLWTWLSPPVRTSRRVTAPHKRCGASTNRERQRRVPPSSLRLFGDANTGQAPSPHAAVQQPARRRLNAARSRSCPVEFSVETAGSATCWRCDATVRLACRSRHRPMCSATTSGGG
jgi:hypothetical protein